MSRRYELYLWSDWNKEWVYLGVSSVADALSEIEGYFEEHAEETSRVDGKYKLGKRGKIRYFHGFTYISMVEADFKPGKRPAKKPHPNKKKRKKP